MTFIQAYLSQGIVTRDMRQPRDYSDDIYSNNFLFINLASSRRASKPRDYMFATMPQFPWYQCPASARTMSFSSIFQDFYKQATMSGHPFAHRITRSMTSPLDWSTSQEAWLPSTEQPEPKMLGGFLKLLGQSVQSKSSLGNIHLCSIVQVTTFSSVLDCSRTLEVVDAAMRFSMGVWRESHVGGELSLYGCRPKDVALEEQWMCSAISCLAMPKQSIEWSEEERSEELNLLRTKFDAERQERHQPL